jgi:asparagine synthase (glutamine-hydrolysing)
MTDVMAHRGPDDRGTHFGDGIALGARRLSIVDVAGGHQPLSNEDGSVWAAQNGELYNHEALRRDLARSGHRFNSRCDTEVLPHLYEHYGPSFPKHLRGKFAVAVWDSKNHRAVIARDRLGIKPLYWAQVDDVVLFGSELKSVLASGLVRPDLDFEAIQAYLTLGFFPAPATPLAGVSKLPPAHALIVDEQGARAEQYWSYPAPAVATRSHRTEDEHREGLLAELEESVRLRLMSDVPLGAMLSGGLDSSLVVALMARNMAEPVKTFSVGFREDKEFNELEDARYIADFFGADHHELELSLTDEAVDLPELVWHLDEPLADLSALGFLHLSKLAREHVTVALSGQGADELLGGYERHRTASLIGTWRRVPQVIRRTAEGAALRVPRLRRRARIAGADTAVDRWLAVHAALDERSLQRLARGRLATEEAGVARRIVTEKAHGLANDGDLLSEFLYLDAQLPLVDDLLHYFDRASMAHSLEVRVPFLDHQVVEYCALVPSTLKVRRLQTKHLLKEVARGIVPDQIIDKRKIGFFHRALAQWLEAQVGGALSDYLSPSDAEYREFLDSTVVSSLLLDAQASNGRLSGGRRQLLLSILMLEVWLATYLPRALSGEPTASLTSRERTPVARPKPA